VVAGKQRYRCKDCGCNYREGDERTNEKVVAKKSLCLLFYAMAKGSYRMMGRILEINHTLVSRWVRSFGESLPEPKVSGEMTQMEFDEMRHFVGSKKQTLSHQSR
jgi:transposase-like protein